MKCPFCSHSDTQVVETRISEDGDFIRRRRQCASCEKRFTTYERVQLRDLVVIKSSGKREDFDRSKLERSIRIAMQKRPIEPERIDQMISGIVRRLESLGETDIPSKVIGEIVMEQKLPLSQGEQQLLAAQIVDDMLGLGPLEPLLQDDTITDIMINGPYQIYVEQKGKLRLTDVKFRDNAHVMSIAQ